MRVYLRPRRCLTIVQLLVLVGVGTAHQSSVRAQPFTTILDIPPGPNIANREEIGSDTQLNLGDGGSIGELFSAGSSDGTSSNVEVNIFGGSVARGLHANAGSTVNIAGGRVFSDNGRLSEFRANAGSTVNISGGVVGSFDSGATVSLVAAGGSQVNILDGSIGNGLQALDGSTLNISGGNIGDRFSLGESLADGNVIEMTMTGGAIGDVFRARVGSTVNISGGSFGFNPGFTGAQVNISGGSFGQEFRVERNFRPQIVSQVELSGGTVGSGFQILSGSEVTLVGGDFLINGVAADTNLDLGESDVLTGTLQDGSPFAFSLLTDRDLDGLQITEVALPTADTTPMVVASQSASSGLRAGQSLTLVSGGVLDRNFAVVDATLDIEGGEVGVDLEVVRSQVTISGGTVGDDFHVFSGSQVVISGGSIGQEFSAFPGSEVMISGGQFGRVFHAEAGSQVTFRGGDFLLNGVAPAVPTLTLSDEDVLTGVLEDGSPFIFSPQVTQQSVVFPELLRHDELNQVTLTPGALPTVNTTPIVVDNAGALAGLRPSQTLTLVDGGGLQENFTSVGATLQIQGGQVARNLEVADTQVTVSGGAIGDFFSTYFGSQVNISGGTVGENFHVGSGAQVNVSGGSVGLTFPLAGSRLDISGGTLNTFRADPGSEINISGGVVNGRSETPGQLNVSGGTVVHVTAQSGSEVVISDGLVGSLDAEAESQVTITGGTVGGGFFGIDAEGGAQVTISGGQVAGILEVTGNSDVTLSGGIFSRVDASILTLIGGEFLLNGVVPTEPEVRVRNDDVLSGTLEDGSPFIFAAPAFDEIFSAKLVNVPLPAVDTAPMTLDNASAPSGLRDGQALTLVDGGELPLNFPVVGATLNIEGGAVTRGLEVANGQVNISGGSAASGDSASFVGSFTAVADSEVNISGGIVDGEIFTADGSEVNITGGVVERVDIRKGGRVNLSSGVVGSATMFDASELTITGGRMGTMTARRSGPVIRVEGGEFLADGAPPTGNTFTGELDSLYTGTLADGSPFIFTGAEFENIALTTVPVPDVDLTPIVVDSEVALPGLRKGQSLTLVEGGNLVRQFAAIDATLAVEGGDIGPGLEVIDTQVTIAGGTIGDGFTVHAGSQIVMTDGTVGDEFSLGPNVELIMSGGSIGDGFDANGSTITISGGTIGDIFHAVDSELTIVGTDFHLAGNPIPALSSPGDSIVLEDRDRELLTATLADGSPFDLSLNSERDTGGSSRRFVDLISITTVLRLTVPDTICGDFDVDGDVDSADRTTQTQNWTGAAMGEFNMTFAQGDCDGDGDVDTADQNGLVQNWTGAQMAANGLEQSVAIPEPSAFTLVLIAMLGLGSRSARKCRPVDRASQGNR